MSSMKTGNKKHSRKDFAFSLKGDVSQDGVFEGYGAVFGNVDFGGDVIAAGAFSQTIKDIAATGRKLPMLWQHDSYNPIGVFDEVKEDDTGLYVKGRVFVNTRQGADAYELLKGMAITGMSIGYGTVVSQRDENTGIRTLKQLDLYEVSLVTFPMNDAARVDSVKTKIADGELPTEREFEKFLRDAGFSKANAMSIAGHGIRSLLRDAEGKNANKSDLIGVLEGFQLQTST